MHIFTKRKFKQILTLALCAILIFGAFTPAVIYSHNPISIFTLAGDEEEDFERRINREMRRWMGDQEEDIDGAGQMLSAFDRDNTWRHDPDTFSYVLSRVFIPRYLNYLPRGVLASGEDEPRFNRTHVCNPGEPLNLLNHHCNVPNFSAELLQAIFGLFSNTGIQNGSRQSARPAFGLGIPAGIPGETIPLNPVDSPYRFTALELFGYNLRFTDYHGEWDLIHTSTQARLLSNFGFMDNVRMGSAAVWNGITTGASALISGFSFNPVRWFRNVRGAFENAASAALNTLLDTSDLNIFVVDGWRRTDQFHRTLYNVYVLNDRQIVEEAQNDFDVWFNSALLNMANNDPRLQYILSYRYPPVFVYDPNMQTCVAWGEFTPPFSPGQGPVVTTPECIEYAVATREEQFDLFMTENAGRISGASAIGINCGGQDEAGFAECWAEQFERVKNREFNFNGPIMRLIIRYLENQFLRRHPHSDPNRSISRYACADIYGNPMRENGRLVRMYTQPNSGPNEFRDPRCLPTRPPIGGGYFGTGWHDGHGHGPDTRRELYGEPNFMNFFPGGNSGSPGASFFMNVSSFTAQITNVFLHFAFSNLLESLGIVDLIEILLDNLYNSIFLPMSIMLIAFGAVYLLILVIRDFNFKRFFMSVLTLILIFIFGVALMHNPATVVRLVDEIPTQIDNSIASFILNSDDTSICAAGGGRNRDGVRSAQCNVWEFMVFNPWVHGQWGTSYMNLYAAGTQPPAGGNVMQNTNIDLVGLAPVHMGAGHTINNWALYQVSLMTSGNITTNDPGSPSGQVDRNMYRIVDLQAGPNNAALSDTRFIQTWSGQSGSRTIVAFLGAVQSVFGGFIIIGLALRQIELSFLFAIYLIFFPIMMAIGLTVAGQAKFKRYACNLLSLFLKRTVVTLLLIILLFVINAVMSSGTEGTSFIYLFVVIMAILIMFKIYRDEFLKMVKIDPGDSMGGEGFMSGDPDQMKQAMKDTVPLYARQKYGQVTSAAKGMVGGAAGGFLARVAQGRRDFNDPDANHRTMRQSVLEGMRSGQHNQGMREFNRQRRDGFSALGVFGQATSAVKEEGWRQMRDGTDGALRETLLDIDAKSKHGRGDKSGSDMFKFQPEKRLKTELNDNLYNKLSDDDKKKYDSLIDKMRIKKDDKDKQKSTKFDYEKLSDKEKQDWEKYQNMIRKENVNIDQRNQKNKAKHDKENRKTYGDDKFQRFARKQSNHNKKEMKKVLSKKIDAPSAYKKEYKAVERIDKLKERQKLKHAMKNPVSKKRRQDFKSYKNSRTVKTVDVKMSPEALKAKTIEVRQERAREKLKQQKQNNKKQQNNNKFKTRKAETERRKNLVNDATKINPLNKN